MKTMIKFRPKQQVGKFAEEVANEVVDRLKRTVYVKNLNHGTDENTNFIRQWETYKGHKATQCANHDCRNEKNNPTLVGAHVINQKVRTRVGIYAHYVRNVIVMPTMMI